MPKFQRKPDPMKYFSGSVFTRLPLHKLLAGGLAVVMLASIGIGAMAAGVAGALPAPTPSPTPTAAPTPTPSPTPTPEAEPVQIYAEVTVVQQDIGVQLYYLPAAEEEEAEKTPSTGANEPTASAAATSKAGATTAPKASATASPTPKASAAAAPSATPANEEPTPAGPEPLPLTGVEATVVVTRVPTADGDAKATPTPTPSAEPVTEYPLDTETGTVLIEDVEPGDYTVTVAPLTEEGYLLPEAQTVTVAPKVEYKADTEAVKEKIKQASEVNASQEDSGYGTGASAPIVDEVTDTVQYADSAKKEVSSRTVYTAALSADGRHLQLPDGSASEYLPVYEDGTNYLKGAVREGAASTIALSLGDALPGFGGAFRPLAAAAPQAIFRTLSLPGAASSSPEETPTETPDGATPTPGTEPTASPTPEATPTPTETPDGATPTPSTEPTATPTPAPAAIPDSVPAADLQKYFGGIGSETLATYAYVGWQTIDGKQYYYDPATNQPVTGTQVILGVIYQFSSDGVLNQSTRGIDVSYYQGNINWSAVKADGIDFAIIRLGYRGWGTGVLVEDAAFRRNIQGATAAGLRVGVYFFTQAVDEAEAVQEASMVLSLVKGYSLPMGIWFDTENGNASSTGRADAISTAQRTACAVAFCETIRNAGYSAGVYGYRDWFYYRLNFANISKYRTWIAQYRNTLDFKYKYDIWQYTGSGRVNGISTAVDMNIG